MFLKFSIFWHKKSPLDSAGLVYFGYKKTWHNYLNPIRDLDCHHQALY